MPDLEGTRALSIEPWMANEIWHVLVEECGARRGDRTENYSFIHYLEGDAGGFGHEYRFQGALGFGGKFRNNHNQLWHITCYQEHETPERLNMIRRANERLEALRKLYTEQQDA